MLKLLSYLASMALFFLIILIIGLTYGMTKINITIPDYRQLETYEPPVTTRLFAGDGQVMMEYAAEKRLFVPIEKIPEKVKHAFIAAEDKHFYTHSGIDYIGIVRAVLGNLKKIGTGRRPAGASTITQQVAKNFLLSSELSYTRKIKEAIFENTEFSKGTSSYDYLRPYADTTLTNCTFDSGFLMGAGRTTGFTITLNNCVKNGVAVTAENVQSLLLDADDMSNLSGCTIIVNGVTVTLS